MSETAPQGRLAVRARGLAKRYEQGRVIALNGLDLDVAAGEFVAICGPSGCGKTTLLNMVSAIDRPDAGTLEVAGRSIADLQGPASDRFRSEVVGLVFQLHNLLPTLSIVENIQVPMLAANHRCGSHIERARYLLDRIGLLDRAEARPPVLSGGERQRVAIARALANEPEIVLADEPTGSLDSRTGDKLLDLLCEVHAESATTLIVVTHDARVAQRAQRVVRMLDGRAVDAGGA
jgi:putative ABC transport system ATP-binding protein